jgi:hypothetical protein
MRRVKAGQGSGNDCCPVDRRPHTSQVERGLAEPADVRPNLRAQRRDHLGFDPNTVGAEFVQRARHHGHVVKDHAVREQVVVFD